MRGSKFYEMSVVRTFGATRSLELRNADLVWALMFGDERALLQAPIFDGLSFDPFALLEMARAYPDIAPAAGYAMGGRHDERGSDCER